MLRCGVAIVEKSLVLRYHVLRLVGRENPPRQKCPAGFLWRDRRIPVATWPVQGAIDHWFELAAETQLAERA